MAKTWKQIMIERLLEVSSYDEKTHSFILPDGYGDETVYAEVIRIIREKSWQE